MRIVDKISKLIFNPQIRFGYLSRLGMYNKMPDEEYLCKEWSYHFDKPLDLQNPQTFNEKLQWLKIHNRISEYTTMVDKYAVKKYVEQILGGGKNTLFLHLVFGMNLMILISLHYQIALC